MNPLFSKEKLAELLVEEKRVTADKMRELNALSRTQRKTIFQLIMENEIMREDDIIDFLSHKLQVPMLNLQSLRVPKDLIKSIPKKIVDRYQILPLSRIGNLLTLATCDPFELLLYDDIKGLTKCDVSLVLATPKMLSSAIEGYYGEASNLEEILEGIDDDNLEIVKTSEKELADEKPGDQTSAAAADAPVVKMVNLILSNAIKARASDIHFEPYEKEFRVRFRIDGSLKEAYSHSRDLYGPMVARVKIMAALNITEKRIPQDGRFRIRIMQREIDFRVSVLPIYHGEKIVLRVLDRSGVKSGLASLGYTEKPTKALSDAIARPYGMILVTGPTGSGKSTTLYTMLGTLNTKDRNIMTVEDPVEYQIEGITQTQVHSEVGMTFANGLRALLRQSPDIILVGEIRDSETADIGVKAALTGHLVFSTLHTNSASGAMTRLIDMGVEPFLIASSVVCVAAQRLMRKSCQFCKVPYTPSEDALRRAGLKESDMKGVECMKGKGCAKCDGTGYFGRFAAIEVMTVDSEIRDLVIQRKSSDDIHRAAVKKGMETLFDNALNAFKKGTTTLEEVLRVTHQG